MNKSENAPSWLRRSAFPKKHPIIRGTGAREYLRDIPIWGFFLIFCLILGAVFSTVVGAQTMARVGVLPFRIYAQDPGKAAEWLQRMLPAISAELAKDERVVLVPEEKVREALEKAGQPEIDEEIARQIGKAVEADFMILGSITQINEAISLDAKVVDVYQPGILASAFGQSKKLEDFPAAASQVSREIRIKVLKEEMITQIGIEGNRAIEENAIRAVIKMKEGDILSPRTLREDLKSIFQLGYFQDVKAEKRDWGRGKAVFFMVEEKPVIREIKFSGNKKVKSTDLLEAIDLKPRTILNINSVKANLNKILKKYREEAYYGAEAEYELETPKKGDVIVHFKIQENKRTFIRKIAFSGNLHFPDQILKNLLPETREKGWMTLFSSADIYKEDVLERDLDAILLFYFQRGFIEAKVGKPQISIDSEGIAIQIPLEEGRQFKIAKVDIQGDLIAPKEELLKLVNAYPGEILNRDQIRDAVIKLSERYADRGYAFVDVNPQTILHKEKEWVDLIFEINQNSKVYVEKITITGNTKTRDKVIRRELRIIEGELYSLSAMKNSREKLNALGYFKEANLTPKKGSSEDKLNVDLQVEEAPTGAFSIGGGYSSIDKFVGVLSVSQNNLFGRGQKLTATGQLGASSQYYTLGFFEPYLLDTKVSLGMDLYRTYRDYDDYSVKKNPGGAVRLGFPLFEEVRLYTGYRYERVEIADILDTASDYVKEQAGYSTTSSVNLGLRRDTRNHWLDPTAGTDLGIFVDYAGGPLGGDNYFTRYGASAKAYVTPVWELTFMGHGRIGYITGNQGHEVPLQERYRMGGIYSLRGFEAYSIGPKDEHGQVIGGTKELLFNFEMLFPIVREIKLKGVIFFDAGNVWDTGESYQLNDLRTSVGFGFRWMSPVGPLRLEWGYNIQPKEGEKHSNWDFAIGTFF
ncbi:MAG: outer membrane protein assembly complex, YaeT protein [Deltaproteobacteria bacterium]|nr:outer membrane protein assembly complex, YaeT protein [Deltaproteobacteria bacterium]